MIFDECFARDTWCCEAKSMRAWKLCFQKIRAVLVLGHPFVKPCLEPSNPFDLEAKASTKPLLWALLLAFVTFCWTFWILAFLLYRLPYPIGFEPLCVCVWTWMKIHMPSCSLPVFSCTDTADPMIASRSCLEATSTKRTSCGACRDCR